MIFLKRITAVIAVQTCEKQKGWKMNRVSSDIKSYLHHIITALDFYDRMANMPNCNDCGAPKGCQYRPAWGQPVRWNCPHWKEE